MLAVLGLPLAGCVVASAVTTVVLLPIKVVGAGIDAVVTTDAEADEKRGRDAREAEEAATKAQAKAAKADAKAAKAKAAKAKSAAPGAIS
ncbi:MAG: hypothetical protein ACRCUI_15560 [Polymorphobacter sp.]